MSDGVIPFPVKGSFDRAWREQNAHLFAASRGYPAVRDPAAVNPVGILVNDMDEASLRRARQHYSVFTIPEV